MFEENCKKNAITLKIVCVWAKLGKTCEVLNLLSENECPLIKILNNILNKDQKAAFLWCIAIFQDNFQISLLEIQISIKRMPNWFQEWTHKLLVK